MNVKHLFTTLFIAVTLAACGGGDDTSFGTTTGSESGGTTIDASQSYRIAAELVSDSCGERITDVNQDFAVESTGAGLVLDTSIIKMPATEDGSTLIATFSESNGSCTRTYLASFENWTSDAPQVTLTSQTNCGGGVSCESKWVGTSAGTPVSKDFTKTVTGANCVTAPAEVGYRASLFECNGNAAVLMSGQYRNNYSVVVRTVGQFNDRDPNNTSCGTNRCSPYKTQKKIELADKQVNCLGDSGFSSYYDGVTRISVKYTATIANKNDESQFQQYCLNSKTTPMN